MLNKLKQECKILGVSLCVGLLFAIGVAGYSYVYSQTVQRDIADNVIRFHVMAHSDDDIDQALKERVRLDVLSEFSGVLADNRSIEETRNILTEYLPSIQAYAEKSVRREGFDHPVSANIAQVFFPTRHYGGMAFPPGEYEAVQIIIGNGAGSNWWCLMFPPLCYMDMTATDSGRQQMEDTLSQEGFRLLTYQESESTGIAVRFRVVEWWQNRRAPAQESQPMPQMVRR
ncbi:MAG: stage II sporulation protein R [Defluviitaleaceae bacterium]|nr:stage II sporulation protein R [Defluviitaleaceae bacterium]